MKDSLQTTSRAGTIFLDARAWNLIHDFNYNTGIKVIPHVQRAKHLANVNTIILTAKLLVA